MPPPHQPNTEETSVVPRNETNAALCSELVEEFQRLIRTHLRDDELQSLDDVGHPARFDAAVVGGDQMLKLTFFGGQTWLGWDGTADGARVLVRDLAEMAAMNVSGDHWRNGTGWQQQTSYGEAE